MTYMGGVWLADGPCYVVRATGGGENILRAGRLLDAIRGGMAVPNGPVWLSQASYDALTTTDRASLKQRGVRDIRVIPTTLGGDGNGFPAVQEDNGAIILSGQGVAMAVDADHAVRVRHLPPPSIEGTAEKLDRE